MRYTLLFNFLGGTFISQQDLPFKVEEKNRDQLSTIIMNWLNDLRSKSLDEEITVLQYLNDKCQPSFDVQIEDAIQDDLNQLTKLNDVDNIFNVDFTDLKLRRKPRYDELETYGELYVIGTAI
jgi:hypothetical protein